jgi:hypothetical protein
MTMGFGTCATCGMPQSAADQKFCATCGSALSPATPPPVEPPPYPQSAWSMPPAPQYPPGYQGGPTPPYVGVPGLAAPRARSPRGRGVKILSRVLTFVGVLLVVVLVAVSYLGFAQVPGLSAAFGMDHARDLHMVKDSAALDAFCTQWGIERPSPVTNYTFTAKHHGSGSVQIDGTISEAALAALPEYSNSNKYFDQLQFRIHEGYAEISAFVHVPGYPVTGPVYGKASIVRTSSTTVSVSFSDLEFGRVGVPGNVVDQAVDHFNSVLNREIADNGVSIDTLQLHEGGIRFKGTWPKTITAP